MTWLVYTAFILASTVSNFFPCFQPYLQLGSGIFNVGNALAWVVVFLVMADKNSASFTFTAFINSSGWASKGWVFVLSMYVPIYGLYGTDGILHRKSYLQPCRVLAFDS